MVVVRNVRVLGLLVLACAVFCVSAHAGELDCFQGMEGTLDIAGGTAHIPVMKEAAQKIMTFNPRIKITIAAGGSGVGVQKVGEGMVGIGNTGRALSQAEIEKFGLKSFPFAIDGVAVAVNPENPISELTSSEVQDIFSGKIKNWKDLGGKDAIINLYTRDEASGTREVF
ncbi:MAG: substrate-binding domain-containing protein, partial [Syntrophaceae bacterium]|nr:substrate-binding domain-containing protein [Syntrophaceae bacterium]